MTYRAFFSATLVAALVGATAGPVAAQTGQTPMPDSHREAGFLSTHGQQAQANVQMCSVCHAREYCSGCHVNASEVPAIQALRSDPDVAAYVAGREWPAPASHTEFFLRNHRAEAASATASCAVCHVVEQQCQSCHLGAATLERPGNVRERQDVDLYHPYNFLQQHSQAAWQQESECASCHNPEAFCRSCHTGLGTAGRGDLSTVSGYHNRNASFTAGHGQAARQGLESCAACHQQEFCLQCHSAKMSRRINPHGPGFDASKLQGKNPQLCAVCHFGNPLEP